MEEQEELWIPGHNLSTRGGYWVEWKVWEAGRLVETRLVWHSDDEPPPSASQVQPLTLLEAA